MENILGFNHYGRFQHEIEIVNCGHCFGNDWGDCYRGGKEVEAKSGDTGNDNRNTGRSGVGCEFGFIGRER
jgi:hypothetical protein